MITEIQKNDIDHRFQRKTVIVDMSSDTYNQAMRLASVYGDNLENYIKYLINGAIDKKAEKSNEG